MLLKAQLSYTRSSMMPNKPGRPLPTMYRLRRRYRLPAIGLAVVLIVTGCSSESSPSADTRTVDVLWYGEQPDGSILGGTLEAFVDLERTDGGVSIDVDGIRQSGAGETWAVSAWTAAMVALLFYGGVPDGLNLAINVTDQIDGPSAGGLMTLATLADLLGVANNRSVTMTGTIYPNGAIGPVGGIPEKLRAAQAAGIETVLVPASKRIAVDPRTNTEVDVQQLADELGIEVVFVRSISEARPYLFDEPPLADLPPLPAVPANLAAVFNADAESLAQRLDRLMVAPAPNTAPNLAAEAAELQRILDLERSAYEPNTSRSDFFIDYVIAAETERLVVMWNDEVDLINLAAGDGLAAATAQVRQDAETLRATATDLLVEIAESPHETIEQLMALVDVAEWATDAIEVAASALVLIDGSPDIDLLAQLAGDVSRENFNLDVFVPPALAAARFAGSIPLRPTTLTELQVFTDVISRAVDANEALIDLLLNKGGSAIDATEVRALLEVEDAVDVALGRVDTQAARSIISLADAISRYVMTSTIINLDRTAASNDGLVQRLSLRDPDKLDDQIELALDSSHRALATLVANGADPSYLLWETAWAGALAQGDDDGIITIDERLDGLARLWFANINERILVALTRPVD